MKAFLNQEMCQNNEQVIMDKDAMCSSQQRGVLRRKRRSEK